MLSYDSAHFVFAGFPVWGHTRPLIALALNLISIYPNLYITFLTSSSFYDNVQSEILLYYGTANPSPRLRSISLGTLTGKLTAESLGPQLMAYFGGLPAALAPLLSNSLDGTGFQHRPTLVVADVCTRRGKHHAK